MALPVRSCKAAVHCVHALAHQQCQGAEATVERLDAEQVLLGSNDPF